MAYTNEALGKALEDLTLAYNNFIEKAKEAAIAVMGDTVIAQIKQDAKDHISAELAAQKAALEKAIENAKIAINNSSTQAHTTLEQAAATASGELTATAEAKKLELSALIQSAEEALQEKVNEAKSYIDAQLSAASQGLQESINTKVNSNIIQQLLEKTSNEIPLPPSTESGAAGVAGVMETLSRADHQHPSEIEAYSFQEDFFFLKFRNGFLIQGLKVSKLTADRYEEKTLPHACTSFNYATAVGQWNENGLVGSVNVELSLSKIRFKSTVSSINAWFLIFGI